MTPEAPSRNPQTKRGQNEAAERLRQMLRNGIYSDYPYSAALADIDEALATARAEAVQRVVERVLLEAAHYNVLQGKVAHANLRMICRAAIGDSAGEEEGQP